MSWFSQMKNKINKLNLTTKITCSVVFVSFLMNVLLGGCGGTANVVVKKPKNTSLITPKLVSIEPRDNAITVKRNEKIVLKFSVPIDPLTLTVNTEDTQCSGTIQISSYNFRNCVRMNLPELEDGNKRIVLSPKGVYAAQEFHQIRLSTEIKAINGALLKKNLTTKLGFRTTWSQQIGTEGDDTGFAITVDKDGNVYLAGNTSVSESGEESDLFLAKYAPSGFLNWIHQPGFGRSVKAAVLRMKKSGQLSLSGLSQGKNNSAVIKLTYDVNGKKLSSKVIGISGTVSGNGMALDSEGHIYVSAASPFNLMKIRKTGEKMWATQLNPGISLQAIAADSGTGLYLTGSMMRSLDGKKSTGGIDVFLLKMYKTGPKRWSKTFGTKLDDSGTSLAILSDEAVALVGYTTQTESNGTDIQENYDAFVAKYNSEGTKLWTYIFKGTKSEQCTVTLWTPEGNLLVGGYTESSMEKQSHFGKEDAFLAMLDSGGELLWLRQFGTPENERPLGLAIGTEGQIYVTGFTEGRMDGAKYSGGKDIFLVQFNKKGEKQ